MSFNAPASIAPTYSSPMPDAAPTHSAAPVAYPMTSLLTSLRPPEIQHLHNFHSLDTIHQAHELSRDKGCGESGFVGAYAAWPKTWQGSFRAMHTRSQDLRECKVSLITSSICLAMSIFQISTDIFHEGIQQTNARIYIAFVGGAVVGGRRFSLRRMAVKSSLAGVPV